MDLKHFYLLPLKIRDVLAYAYVHEKFISSIPGLGTLFRIADGSFLKNNKPKIIFLAGVNNATNHIITKQMTKLLLVFYLLLINTIISAISKRCF